MRKRSGYKFQKNDIQLYFGKKITYRKILILIYV
ncbi:YARHG domain-containing protein [Bacillus sp. Xin]|nr:YARHG domain-containing protein [Bacillus sp. Xin]NSW37760.1 YARHG domain-containing protein [Bacillus sp. Xin1]